MFEIEKEGDKNMGGWFAQVNKFVVESEVYQSEYQGTAVKDPIEAHCKGSAGGGHKQDQTGHQC